MKILIILTGLIAISYCNVSDAEVERYTKDCVENLKLVGFDYDIPFANYIFAKAFNYTDFCKSFQVNMNTKLNGLWLQNYGKNEKSLGPSLLSVADIKAYIMDFYETNRENKFSVPIDLPKLLNPEEYCEKLKEELRTSSFVGYVTSWIRINIEKCSLDIMSGSYYKENEFVNLISSYELSMQRHSSGVNNIAWIVGQWKPNARKYYNYHITTVIKYSKIMPELKIEAWCTTYIRDKLITNPDSTMKARIQGAEQASCT